MLERSPRRRGRPPGSRPPPPPSPEGIKDYRTWVRHLVQYALETGAFSTKEALAAAAGIHGSTLGNLIGGRRRHLGEELARRLFFTLGLDETWTRWLLWWMASQRTRSAAKRSRARAEMRALEPTLRPLALSYARSGVVLAHGRERGDPLTTWLGVAIWTAAQCPNFNPNPSRLAVSLGHVAAPRAIADTLRDLERHGYLQPDGSGRLRTTALEALPKGGATPPGPAESLHHARRALLLGPTEVSRTLHIGLIPESELIPWGWERVSETLDLSHDIGLRRVLPEELPPDPGDVPADHIIQQTLLALLLRRADGPPVEVPEPPSLIPLPPDPPDAPPRRPGRHADPFHFSRLDRWLEAALLANRGTSRPSSGKALVAAGLRMSRLNYIRYPRYKRRYPLDEDDLELFTRCFCLSPAETLYLRRLIGFHQARSVDDRRARLDELVGMLEARAISLGQGATFRARTRLPHILVRLLSARGLRGAENLGRALGWPADQVTPVLQDLKAARRLESPGPFLALPEAADDLGTMLLFDDLLCWATRRLEVGSASAFHSLLLEPAATSLREALVQRQRALVQRAIAEVPTTGGGPFVPVALITQIHPISF